MKRAGLLFFFALAMALSGCVPAQQASAGPDLVSQAAVEATAIIQRARATALVLQAQAQATVLVHAANEVEATPVPEVQLPAQIDEEDETMPTAIPATAAPTRVETQTRGTIELLSVGFAADGADIIVQFKGPPSLMHTWTQGNVSVTDEATGMVYDHIPVAPLIGMLLARPAHEGQIGYVMFVNTPPGLSAGARVTVVLGDFKQEHVLVQ